ncbi:MAG: AMP-binding protein, partial [bacterium]|nr:AMP-binding protein [bacterium]
YLPLSTHSTNSTHSTHSTIYRTGDLARWLPDGNIQFLGRKDHQVKIRGFRVELGEIQRCLLKHGDIKQVLVVVGDAGEKYLCAYLVTRPNCGLQPRELREYLERELPGYMVPSYFVPLDRFPLTANGKIDRSRLPVPRDAALDSGEKSAAPTNAVEEKLLEICLHILEGSHLGIQDNFFEKGGDSIKAIQIASRLYSAGYKVEIKDIFQYPQLSQLARLVKKVKRIPDQLPVYGGVPLTPIQQAFFSHSQIDAHYFNQGLMLRTGRQEGFDEDMIRAVFSRLQEHHDALRMTFCRGRGREEVVQSNQGTAHPLSLAVYDLRGRPPDPEQLVEKSRDIQAGIHLEKGPLMKLALFHLEDGDRLLIVIHHLVVD